MTFQNPRGAQGNARGQPYEGLQGTHQELNPIMGMLENRGLVHTDSMEMSNDPRFFKKSILSKRLSAFSSLSVVSGLMVGTSTAVISMKKNMDLTSFEGQLQFVSFSIMTVVLFANIIATYVGVAQVYHTYRLETAGPTGFEMAASYYLNPNIVAWRHMAVKGMLHSLPLFLISSGIRIQVSFNDAVEKVSGPGFYTARFIGLVFMALYCAMGAVVWYVHWKHNEIFRERYALVSSRQDPYMEHMKRVMANQSNRGQLPLDV